MTVPLLKMWKLSSVRGHLGLPLTPETLHCAACGLTHPDNLSHCATSFCLLQWRLSDPTSHKLSPPHP